MNVCGANASRQMFRFYDFLKLLFLPVCNIPGVFVVRFLLQNILPLYFLLVFQVSFRKQENCCPAICLNMEKVFVRFSSGHSNTFLKCCLLFLEKLCFAKNLFFHPKFLCIDIQSQCLKLVCWLCPKHGDQFLNRILLLLGLLCYQ